MPNDFAYSKLKRDFCSFLQYSSTIQIPQRTYRGRSRSCDRVRKKRDLERNVLRVCHAVLVWVDSGSLLLFFTLDFVLR